MNLNDLFKITTLTDAVEKLPVEPNLLERLGIFKKKFLRTTTILVDVRDGQLKLIPSIPRGGNPDPVARGARRAITFSAAHLVEQDSILPEDVQDVRAFGKEGVEAGLEAQSAVIADRLSELKANISVTLEYHRAGAIAGQVLDASGAVLIDLFTEYGVTQQTASIQLSVATTDVRAAIVGVKRTSARALGGKPVTGFVALCSPQFLDALTDHSKVKAAYANYQLAQDRLAGDLRDGFTYAGVDFIEYDVEVDGKKYIPDGKARFFPKADIFRQYFVPADYNDAVNTLGKEFYAISEERDKGKGWDLEVQSNPITICHFPEALVELSAT